MERLSKDDVQKMQWEVLEAKIGNWIHYMRIAVSIYVTFGSVGCNLFVYGCFVVVFKCALNR